MKLSKKILVCLLVLMMLAYTLPLTVSAANEPTNGKITITGSNDGTVAVSGKTFEIYKIFNATTSSITSDSGETTTNVSYQWYIPAGESKSPYYDFFFTDWDNDGSVLVDPATVTETNSQGKALSYISSLRNDANGMRVFADSLYEYIKAKSIAATDTITADSATTTTQVEFNNLTYGYYLVADTTANLGTSGVRSGIMLDTAAPYGTINLKASKPTINKTIVGINATGSYFNADGTAKKDTDGYFAPAKGVSATIGDEVTFAISFKVPDRSDYQNGYTFGLKDVYPDVYSVVKDSVYVYVSGKEIAGPNSKDGKTEETAPGQNYWIPESGVVDFDLDAVGADGNPVYTVGDIVTVVYSARMDEGIQKTNVNTVTLTYTNDPSDQSSTSTVSSSATVYSYQFTLGKYAGNTDGTATGISLAGATFELYDSDGNKFSFIQRTDHNGLPVYVVAEEGGVYYDGTTSTPITAADLVTTLEVLDETDANAAELINGGYKGEFKIYGLGAGDYELKETKAPDGYMLPQENFGFTISDSFGDIYGAPLSLNFVADKDASNNNGSGYLQAPETMYGSQRMFVKLSNIPGSTLPTTGGMGTFIFTAVGVLIMAGAVVLLILMLRKRSNVK